MADTTTSALNWATVENGKVKTTTSKKSDESNNGTMGYDQFLTLLCAEMQYQDPLEPTSNTEYVAQLATFSQLEAMLGMQDTQKNEMANNLVGKYVILKVSDETTGKTSYVDGKVDYVMYQEDGSQMLRLIRWPTVITMKRLVMPRPFQTCWHSFRILKILRPSIPVR